VQAIHTLVAATDFSPWADQAVMRATTLAKQLGAELTLLNVVSPMTLYPGLDIGLGAEAYAAAGEHAAADRLEALAGVLRDRYAIPVRTAQRIGRAYRQIADYAATLGADLVVVGARGENSLARLLMGSTAQRLLRVRLGPVLVVRTAPLEPYCQPLAAVDFSPDSHAALAWAARLAGEGRLEALHVLPEEDEGRLRGAGLDSEAIRQRRAEMRAIAENLMANLLADLPVPAVGHVETGPAAKAILARAGESRADLIVLGRHGTGGLEEWLLGSVSKDVAQAADCDVLLVGADARSA
jgi:nucleotide-binding universal stress UspA family protein